MEPKNLAKIFIFNSLLGAGVIITGATAQSVLDAKLKKAQENEIGFVYEEKVQDLKKMLSYFNNEDATNEQYQNTYTFLLNQQKEVETEYNNLLENNEGYKDILEEKKFWRIFTSSSSIVLLGSQALTTGALLVHKHTDED